MTISGQQSGESPEEALQALILDRDLEKLEDLLVEFNLFDVLGIARRETQHSALIAWLLDPSGSHGLRDYFLRNFLSQVAVGAHENGIPAPTPLDVDSWNLGDIEVATERHHIDILLMDKSDGFVCPIENKIGSAEHSNQLSRYLETVEHEYEGLTAFPIFLTPEGVEPETTEDTERYVPFNFRKVAGLIEQALISRGSTISGGVSSFLEQYMRSLRRRVLDTTDNIDELAYQLYNNHRTAIDRIIRAKSLPDTMTWDIIDSVTEQYECYLKNDFHTGTTRRLYSPSLEEISELKEGKGWTKSGRVALFEFIHRVEQEKATLYLMIGPGPQCTRDRLYKLAQRSNGPWNPDNKMNKGNFKIYRKPILSQQDYRPFDRNKARLKIEEAIKDFIENDYWRLVNGVRQAFDLEPISNC